MANQWPIYYQILLNLTKSHSILPNLAKSHKILKNVPNLNKFHHSSPNLAESYKISTRLLSLNLTKSLNISAYLTITICQSRTSCGNIL